MSDFELLVLAAVLAPVTVVALVAMARGYHLTFKLFRRPPERTDEDA